MLEREKIIQIFKASPIPTSIVRADAPRFTFILVNDAYTKMTQMEEEHLLGKSLFEAFPENPYEEKPTGVEKLRKSFEKVLESKQVDELPATRYDIVLDDGKFKEIYWEINNTPVLDENGEVEFIINSATNITDRLLSERENKLMLNHTEDSFILIDRNLIIQNYNELFAQNYKEIFGIEVRKGDSVLDYAQPERRETVKGIYERVFEGETVEVDLPLKTQRGNARHFSIKYKPVHDEKNNITGSFISLIERTEENNAKLELEKNEARFRALIENGSDVLFILNPEGKPTYISPSVENVLGYTLQEANEMEMISVVHPDDVEIIFSELQKCMDKPGIPMKVTPARMKHKDGSYRWFEGTITNMLHDPAIEGIVDNFRDITERKVAEEKIEKAKTKYQSLIQTVDGIVWEADAKTFVFNYVSPQSKEILGYEPNEWIGKHDFWKKKIHPEDRDEAVNYCHNQTKKGRNHSFEYRMQKADGEYIWIRDMVTVMKEEGKPVSIRGLMMDITNKKLTETQLNQKREQLQRIMDQSVDMICTARDGKFLSVNAASKYILGYEPNEMIGRPFTDFLVENDKVSTLTTADYIQSDNNITDFENRYYNKDGRIVHLTWSARWDDKEKKCML